MTFLAQSVRGSQRIAIDSATHPHLLGHARDQVRSERFDAVVLVLIIPEAGSVLLVPEAREKDALSSAVKY
eukprot:2616583-Rhodomonas_salina.1